MEPGDSRRRDRFIFVVWGLTNGGTLSVLRQFWPRLAAHGEIELLTHGPNSVEVDLPTRVVGGAFSTPLRFPGIWVYFARMAIAALRAAGSDPRRSVLIAQDSLATGAAAAVAGRLLGVPVLIMEHGTTTAIRSRYFWRHRLPVGSIPDRLRRPFLRSSIRLLHTLCLRLADGALLAGDEAATIYERAGLGGRRLMRYHFPVDLDRFRPATDDERARSRAELGLPTDALVIASVSRLAPEKGLDRLVAAVAGAVAAAGAPRPVLVMAGGGPLREPLERQAASAGVDLHFAGNLDADRVAELLRAADLFVYAGLQGVNTPYAVLEAMASGLPVVATTAPQIHAEMLANGRGAAVRPGDVSAMAGAIARYLASADARRASGTAARRYVEEHHAPEVLDREVDELLARLAAGFGPHR